MRTSYRGWHVVAVSAIGMSTGPGQFAYGSLGLFMVPLAAEFGWSRGGMSLALTVHSLALALANPYCGVLLDRIGARRVLLPSLLAFAALLAAIPLFATQLWHLWLAFALIGSLAAGANSMPWLRVVSTWFGRRRAFALGVAMAGAGTGFVYVPPILQATMETWGWRGAYLLLAATVLMIAVPLAARALDEAPSAADLAGRDEFADGAPPVDADSASQRTDAAARLFADPRVWHLLLIFALLSFGLYGLLAHLAPMQRDLGSSAAQAAWLQSALGVSVVVSRALVERAMDRFFAPHVSALCFLASAVGIAALAGGATGAPAFAAVLCVGLSLGAEMDMLAYFASRYFGLASFGRAYGVLFTAFLFGTSLGPPAFGHAFEVTGSYSTVLVACVITTLLACFLTLGLPRYPTEQPA